MIAVMSQSAFTNHLRTTICPLFFLTTFTALLGYINCVNVKSAIQLQVCFCVGLSTGMFRLAHFRSPLLI